MRYVAKVPLRVSLFGGGTDIPPYCNESGGEILFSTINKYAYCEIEPVPGQKCTLLGETDEVYQEGDEHYDGKYGIVKAVLHEIQLTKGCRITIYSDVLQGTGLGGSSAQIAAIILACYSWEGKMISKKELALLTYHIEREVMEIQGGYQDPIATVYGGIGYLKIRDMSNFSVESLDLDESKVKELRQYLLLYYTGLQHNSSVIMKEHIQVQMKHRKQSNQTLDFMKELAGKARMVLEKGDVRELGAMLDYGWEYKKRMSSQISNDYLNRLYESSKDKGALGGKILGAGGGGYLLLFADPCKKQNILSFLFTQQGKAEDWEFDFTGARVEMAI